MTTATQTKTKGRGRPTKDKIRNKQIRFGKIHDELIHLVREFESENDKQKILELIQTLSEPPKDKRKQKCS